MGYMESRGSKESTLKASISQNIKQVLRHIAKCCVYMPSVVRRFPEIELLGISFAVSKWSFQPDCIYQSHRLGAAPAAIFAALSLGLYSPVCCTSPVSHRSIESFSLDFGSTFD